MATSVLVTSILTPIVTMWFEKRARAKGLPIKPSKYNKNIKAESSLSEISV
ncbi:hypothetical protein [Clostridium beijerinckii]|uniref:hypothetical protein n=1 Tax=Clostridium beijerinckii TaxID=1520 RepID=UPI001FA87795|nr:hypothetical protein [Clostridium beijerinckii]